jgi:hypothetical protein
MHEQQGEIFEVRNAAAALGAGVGKRALRAVSDLLSGDDFVLLSDVYGVPVETLERWLSSFWDGGVEALAPLRPLDDLPATVTSSDMYQRASSATPGLEKTVFTSLATLYRGATLEETCAFHHLKGGELKAWVRLLANSGPAVLSRIYRRSTPSSTDPRHAYFGEARLPTFYDARLLRDFHRISKGPICRRLLIVILAYEGQTARQISDAVGASESHVEQRVGDFRRGGLLALISRSVGAEREQASSGSKPLSDQMEDAVSLLVDGDPPREDVLETDPGQPYETHPADEPTAPSHEGQFTGADDLPSRLGRTGDIVPFTRPERKAVLPPLRPDIGPPTFIPYLVHPLPGTGRRIEALYDYSAGMAQAELLEKHAVEFEKLDEWVDELNDRGVAALASSQSPAFMRERCAALLEMEIGPPEVAAVIGMPIDFVKGVALERGIAAQAPLALPSPQYFKAEANQRDNAKPKAQVSKLVRFLPADLDARKEVKIAAASKSEPLRTYAEIILRMYEKLAEERVLKDYSLNKRELERIVTAFSLERMAGIASDPLGVATTRKGKKEAEKVGFRFDDEGRNMPVAARIRSYMPIADPKAARSLEALALAAEGMPASTITDLMGLRDDEHLDDWVASFNRDGSKSFIDASADKIGLERLMKGTDSLQALLFLHPMVPDKVLRKNILIIAGIAQGMTRSAVSDARKVTHRFVTACIEAFDRAGIAGLASMPVQFPEMERVHPSDNQIGSMIVLSAEPSGVARTRRNLHPTTVPERDETSPPAPTIEEPAGETGALQVLSVRRPVPVSRAFLALPPPRTNVPVYHAEAAIHVPKPGSPLQADLLIALTGKGIEFTTKHEALARLQLALERADFYGGPGVMMVGLDTDGRTQWSIEETVWGDDVSVETFVRTIASKIDEEALPAIARSATPWHLIPFYKTSVSPTLTKQGALERARSRHAYEKLEGEIEVRLWMPGGVLMQPTAQGWEVAEATALEKKKGRDRPDEMFDLVSDF